MNRSAASREVNMLPPTCWPRAINENTLCPARAAARASLIRRYEASVQTAFDITLSRLLDNTVLSMYFNVYTL